MVATFRFIARLQASLIFMLRMKQIWNLLENRDLFKPRIRPERSYSPAAHLAEMIALLGPPPQILIMNHARNARRWTWTPMFENSEGKLCERVEDYFGGPFGTIAQVSLSDQRVRHEDCAVTNPATPWLPQASFYIKS